MTHYVIPHCDLSHSLIIYAPAYVIVHWIMTLGRVSPKVESAAFFLLNPLWHAPLQPKSDYHHQNEWENKVSAATPDPM